MHPESVHQAPALRQEAEPAVQDRADPISDAPCAKLIVAEDESITASFYAPGLPPGEYDVWCVPLLHKRLYLTFEQWAEERMPFVLEKHEPHDDGARLATLCARLAFDAGRSTLPEP